MLLGGLFGKAVAQEGGGRISKNKTKVEPFFKSVLNSVTSFHNFIDFKLKNSPLIITAVDLWITS
jgi:hypothetical protein